MKIANLLLSACSLLVMGNGCTGKASNFTERSFVVNRDETVRIVELDMSIYNKGCGRMWMTDNGGERAFCELEVKTGDSIYRFGRSYDSLVIKDVSLKIDKMNPWNNMEDSVPAGGCRIIVTKLPGK